MHNKNIINENQTVRYRVLLNGKLLTECLSYAVANNFVTGLPKEQQESATIVPFTSEGRQILTENNFA